jgi:hypothetical protein
MDVNRAEPEFTFVVFFPFQIAERACWNCASPKLQSRHARGVPPHASHSLRGSGNSKKPDRRCAERELHASRERAAGRTGSASKPHRCRRRRTPDSVDQRLRRARWCEGDRVPGTADHRPPLHPGDGADRLPRRPRRGHRSPRGSARFAAGVSDSARRSCVLEFASMRLR